MKNSFINEIPFHLVFVDPRKEVLLALKEEFSRFLNVSFYNGVFQDIPEFDCMVSAANSFGLMGGGVDWSIINYFGEQLESKVRNQILNRFKGEQPVGTSMIVETGNPIHPFIAHTPTMRIAMSIKYTDNVYQAMRAMLIEVMNHNDTSERKIKYLACPGLGTSTGKLSPPQSAKQMALALRNVLNPPKSISSDYAYNIHREISEIVEDKRLTL